MDGIISESLITLILSLRKILILQVQKAKLVMAKEDLQLKRTSRRAKHIPQCGNPILGRVSVSLFLKTDGASKGNPGQMGRVCNPI